MIYTSKNGAAATTLVNRNGRVLHEKLEAFGAPDEPKILSFHGHALLTATVSRLQKVDALQ